VPELSVGAEPWPNLLIEGDNYEALRFLRMTFAGWVKCIFADPPGARVLLTQQGVMRAIRDLAREARLSLGTVQSLLRPTTGRAWLRGLEAIGAWLQTTSS